MKFYSSLAINSFLTTICLFSSLNSTEPLPQEMKAIMHQPKYNHSIWGIYVKDLQTGKILFDLNSNKLFSPASTTKIFSVEALLNAYGDDYRFKTPVYAEGNIENGRLQGNLILVAQGDLTMGGRQFAGDKIEYTKLDHIIANEIPGVILTKGDPLNGLNELARQVYQKGIREITESILIDDSLFEITEKRGMTLSPMMINENLIDIIINPTSIGHTADLIWRPQVPGYTITNQLKTVDNGDASTIEITSDNLGRNIVVKGTVSVNEHDMVCTFPIQDPNFFARSALTQALKNQGIKINTLSDKIEKTPSWKDYRDLQPIATFTSPPLSEYAKLILKVSHNLGADLVPLLLAAHEGKKNFDEGMVLFGNFVTQDAKLSPDVFVFIDAAGGNENRLTPQAEVQLLEFISKQSASRFKHFFDDLPILGVDGSLEDFAKKTEAVGKVRAKPGTGVAFNVATGEFFLITQALAGYIEGKNGHLFAYMIAVNNAKLPTINDTFSIFEDVSQLSSIIYNYSDVGR